MSNVKFSLAASVFAFVATVSASEINTKVSLRLQPEKRQPKPRLAPASNEAELAVKRFQLPDGFQAGLFAAEPMLANPVAFCLDERGKVFVSETHRYRTSVLDIRHYMAMLDADLACRTVEDRLKMTEKFFGAEAKDLAVETEIIRLLEDRDGDGKADFSSVYAEGFDSALDGIASGVLAHRGKVWFANIPAIWELTGMNPQGHAEARKVMSYGYGVRFSYTGHDLHGLILGPDGKLYFSFGDRGATVKTKEGKTLAFPDEGAVFRCNQNGSDLEVVHRGLRNPQELAFDEFGNLFTGDNDFDHGDRERWVYVVEGGDSGWRVGYQHPPLGYDSVPWMLEQLWVPHFDGQAAYILPPIANLNDGPSGLTYYPGTGLPEKYNGSFFLSQFKGSAAKSGIETFKVKPKGASFELIGSEHFIWNVAATDVDFGPDGYLYFSDWGEGWERTRKGRIYRVAETNSVTLPIVTETKKLLATGLEKTTQWDLLRLLGHANMKVRLEAQYTLADRGKKSILALVKLAADVSAAPVARRHAIWALGQISRKNPSASVKLLPLLEDKDAEIRAQSAKILGDARFAPATPAFLRLLRDVSPRVRFFAAQSLGKLHREDSVAALLSMLRENNNADVYLRHVGAIALANCANPSQLAAAGKDDSAAVRMAVLLALRKLERPEIADFLNDGDELLVIEAARAINDVPIENGMPKLANLIFSDRSFEKKYEKQFQALQLRIVNANSRLGAPENALALASYAVGEKSNPAAATEALNALATWDAPGQRDRVVGVYRPYSGKRDAQASVAALKSIFNEIISAPRAEQVMLAAIDAANRLEIADGAEALQKLFLSHENSEAVRLAALQSLGQSNPASLLDVVKVAQKDASEIIRSAANKIATQLAPDTAVLQIRAVLTNGSIIEKQGALSSLASIPGKETETLLTELIEDLNAGKLPRELELELLEAVAKNADPTLTAGLKAFQSDKNELLRDFGQVLFGGNAEAGKKIFFERPEASCVRCHKVKKEGGEVGPDMTGIGSRATREDLIESLVHPNAKISPGFETVLVSTTDGASYAGVFKSENQAEMVLNSPEDGIVSIAKDKIKTRTRGNSGMPGGLDALLSKRDLRDLMEFLATLK